MNERTVQINIDAIIKFQNKHDYTDEGFALDMGISVSFFSKVKCKKRNPGRNFILGLIRAGMNPTDIFIIKYLTMIVKSKLDKQAFSILIIS